jgi:hypothetical protein
VVMRLPPGAFRMSSLGVQRPVLDEVFSVSIRRRPLQILSE